MILTQLHILFDTSMTDEEPMLEFPSLPGTREQLCLPIADGMGIFLVHQQALDLETIGNAARSALPDVSSVQVVNRDEQAIADFLRLSAGLMANSNRNIRERLDEALSHSGGGPSVSLQRLFQNGILLHEKIRQNSNYFDFPVQPETVFQELCLKIVGKLSGSTVLGFGEGAEMHHYLGSFVDSGASQVRWCSRSAPGPGLARLIEEGLVSRQLSAANLSEANIMLLFPGFEEQLTEKDIVRLMRRRGGPLVILDHAGSRLDHQRLQRIDNCYIYVPDVLQRLIDNNAAEQRAAAPEIDAWVETASADFYQWLNSNKPHRFAGIVGADQQMQRLFNLISRIAGNDITVLVDGESGTGKELVATAIHDLSGRSNRPFQVINCGAIPENLLESELFGHVRGAFTGAVAAKKGLFELADRGTLFLDEIADLPPLLQVKLLRFLQEGEIRPVGSNVNVMVDVRIIAATNQKLEQLVEKGVFRSDLFYRLNVVNLTLPPLRERNGDISLLANFFLKKYAGRYRKNLSTISRGALSAMQTYRWPGNVRELENAIERAVALAFGQTIRRQDLPPAIMDSVTDDAKLDEAQRPLTLREVERRHIMDTLDEVGWNYERAARALGIGRTTLWRKLREYNVSGQPDKTEDSDAIGSQAKQS